MKYSNAVKKLSKFRSYSGKHGHLIFQSRSNLDKIVQLVNQDGQAIALPCYVDENGREEVAFHAKTIKSLVEFLENK
jgi:hypothetical protein